jgi:predicted Rossmann fold nucleotide-binding protein DprA/Smf involved in DNA uptake
MISENIKAILLLTSHFNTNEVREYKTFSINEYGFFAYWLYRNGFKPESLLNDESFNEAWALWDNPLSHIEAKKVIDFKGLEKTISNISFERIQHLLNRGASLSLALDKWQSAGVWIMDRQHPHYPQNFRKHLKHQSPALLFGVGDSELLTKNSIGFVGSRDCSVEDEQSTKQYVEQINRLDFQVVSGAAKGVDTHAMLASLENGNEAIGIMAESLFRASASNNWRQHLKDNKLVLISPFFPESRFTPANAMARNKYIYLLSKATVVITSGEKGGTWEGAKENLKKNWVPTLVSTHKQPLQAGNHALLTGNGLTRNCAKSFPITLNLTDEQIINLINGKEVETIYKISTSHSEAPEVSQGHQSNLVDSSLAKAEKEKLNISHKSTEPTQQSDLFGGEVDDEMVATSNKAKQNDREASKDKEELDSNATEKVLRIANEAESLESQTTAGAAPQLNDLNIRSVSLIDLFYQKLSILIEETSSNLIDKSELENHFPEFEIISKTALDKWLKHLVDEGKLLRPSAKKKQFSLPTSSQETSTIKSKNETQG